MAHKTHKPMTQAEQLDAFEREIALMCNRYVSEFELKREDLLAPLQYRCLMLLQEICEE